MIQLLVWSPFILTVLIFGSFSLVLGYKRGYIRAAISVLATVISGIVSVLISKLISSLLKGTLSVAVLDLLNLERASADTKSLVTSLTAVALAIAVFAPVFILFSAIIKNVASAVNGKWISDSGKKAEKFGGLAISVVDTLIFACILTLPIYGTVTSIAPAAEALITAADKLENKDKGSGADAVYLPEIREKTGGFAFVSETSYRIVTEEEDEESDYGKIVSVISEISDAGICDIVGSAPFELIYDALGTVSFNGSKVCVTETVREIGEMSDDIISSVETSPKDYGEKEIGVIRDLEKTVKDNEILLSAFCEAVKKASGSGDGKASEFINKYAEKISPDSVGEDISAICDILCSAIEKGVIREIAENKDHPGDIFDENSAVCGDFIYDFTKAINNSSALSLLKSEFINLAIDELDLPEESSEMIKDAFDNSSKDKLTEEETVKEGDALKEIIIGAVHLSKSGDDSSAAARSVGEIIDGIARHPSIGAEKAGEIVESLVPLLDVEGLEKDSPIVRQIKESVKESIKKPVEEATLPDITETAANVAGAVSSLSDGNMEKSEEIFADLLSESKSDALKVLSQIITPDVLAPFGLADNAKAVELMSVLVGQMSEADLDAEQANKEATAISGTMGEIISLSGSKVTKEKITALFGSAKGSTVICSTLDIFASENGSNSLGLDLSKAEKQAAKDAVSGFLKGDSSEEAKKLADNILVILGAK